MSSLLCSMSLLACHHRREPIAHSLEGVEFRAHARAAGANLDTLAIDIVAVNRSRREKILEFSQCGFRPRVSFYRLGEKESVWDMDRWQDSDGPSPGSQFRIERVCILSLTVMSLPAGATASLGAITLPLQVVFGDSLAAGSYRVTSLPGPINYRGKPLEAGTVELKRPAPWRALNPTIDPGGEKGVLSGIGVDSMGAEARGRPVFVVDGLILPDDVEPFEEKFKKYLTVNQIAEVESLMPGEALRRLGPLGRNGAVMYTSKKYVRDHREKFPLLGPDDFNSIGSIIDLPAGRKVRLLQVLFLVAGAGPSAADRDSLPPGVMIGTPEAGASMSLYISTQTPKSETQILEQEARDVIEHMRDQIARHDVRGITVVVCRSKACAEMRGMSSETFYFRKYGSSWALDTRWDDR